MGTRWVRRVATAAMLGSVLVATPAEADPQKGYPTRAECEDGTSYDLVFRASATWNALLDTGSTSALHLVSYETTFVVTWPDGTVAEFGPFLEAKGGNDRSKRDLVHCEHSAVFEFDDGRVVHAFGPIVGWFTPASR